MPDEITKTIDAIKDHYSGGDIAWALLLSQGLVGKLTLKFMDNVRSDIQNVPDIPDFLEVAE